MKKIIFILVLISCQIAFSQNWVRKLDGYSMWSLGKDFSGNVYAGTSGTLKNIFKSTNGGNSWDTVLSNGAANFLSIACDTSNYVYAANVANGLVLSTNGGLNWTTIPGSVFNSQSVNAVACGRNGYVYAGTTNGGIYRSTNYGSNFTYVALNGLTIVVITVDRFNSNIIYAGASSASPPNYGFYRSTDGGLNFSSNLNPLNVWGIAEKMNGNLYTITTSSPYPLSKSTDGGFNWVTTSNLTGAMRGMCLDMAENIYTAGNGGVFKSTNDGVSFTNHNITYSANHVICYQNKILVAVAGTANGGVYIFTDSLVGIQGRKTSIPEKFELYQNFPNPFNPTTEIKFDLPFSSFVTIKICNLLGQEVAKLLNNEVKAAGSYSVTFDGSNYASGMYFYKIEAGAFAITKKMVLVK